MHFSRVFRELFVMSLVTTTLCRSLSVIPSGQLKNSLLTTTFWSFIKISLFANQKSHKSLTNHHQQHHENFNGARARFMSVKQLS
jgi:hypothetical protein